MSESSMRTSMGHVFAQQRELAGSPPGPTTCVWPTELQADHLAESLRGRNLSLVSIGCGEGFLEAQLEQRGVAVTAVDVHCFSDPERYSSMRCFCSQIRRVRPDELYDMQDPERSALAFVWGRNTPWREYLSRFQVPMVIIVGDPTPAGDACVTEPSATALLDESDTWILLVRVARPSNSRRRRRPTPHPLPRHADPPHGSSGLHAIPYDRSYSTADALPLNCAPQWRLPIAAAHPAAVACAYVRASWHNSRALAACRRSSRDTSPASSSASR